ncbi:hypothetical protein MLD38_036356 [Melastoma candidum]|uniref:Uncharacterized protein n=1 Tax=Melastoma candidum TaxID=119954 RepID=A0ACB9LIT0_9MYRT|nr:hypothetical protein MLD38_036356 [Melastoma candidum]
MDRILHPSHHHPLNLKPIGKGKRKGFNAECCVCRLRISDPVAYSCRDCQVFAHKSCAESPLPVHGHPFHPDHPLLLLHTPSEFDCPACKNHHGPLTKYGCEGCGFYLDLDCAMSASVAGELAPPDVAAIQSYLANEHDHPLTRFFAARRRYLCSLCQTAIQGEGYICLEPSCKFHAHEGCIRGLYYEDGTRIPQVAHDHQLFTHHDGSGTSKCKICKLKVPGEKIGCPMCSLFYHRKCLDVPDRLDYPPHSDHPLTLSIAESNEAGETLPCRSCGGRLLHQEGPKQKSELLGIGTHCCPATGLPFGHATPVGGQLRDSVMYAR